MKSRIWRIAGVGLFCAGLSVHSLAADMGELMGSKPQGGAQEAPRAAPQPQNRPQPSEPRGRGENRPQPSPNMQDEPRRGPSRPADAYYSSPPPRTTNELIQSRPNEVRQTQQPRYDDYRDNNPRRDNNYPNGGTRNWNAGNGRPGDDRWHGNHGNGWGNGPQYRPGQVIDRFPGQNYRVPYRGQDYFFSDGYWYRPQGPRYVVVTPPYGVRVRYLPDYAQRMWVGNSVFFQASGTYYQWLNDSQEYVVVNQPVASAPQPASAQQPANGPYDVAFYPVNGQTPEQIQQDRYDCQRWSTDQSGFDPRTASYAPAQAVVDQYRQSLANCLASRGYQIN